MTIMIEIANLEFHAAHACNLHCAQCSHYSNFHAGGIVSVEVARENFNAWRGRLAPKQIAILGGEPTLNPNLIQIIELSRRAFPDATQICRERSSTTAFAWMCRNMATHQHIERNSTKCFKDSTNGELRIQLYRLQSVNRTRAGDSSIA
jgi:uncharacterized radical SAM superfamily Fe-S cluster-containing enzyme